MSLHGSVSTFGAPTFTRALRRERI